MANELDSMFEQFAKKAEADAKAGKKQTFTRDLEEIKWTGLETDTPKVIRVVGAPYDSNVDDFTAKTVTIARIIGDDGKKFRVIRPSFTENPNYILNRIIARVKQAKWVNKEKTYPVKENCPEIYNIIDKNGLAKTDPKAMYDKGWQGKDVLLMNVIDREQMEWHKANKHTMLLAKSVNVDDNGNEWADEGISSYATASQFTQLFKYYKSWENYDIVITKTGNKEHPFIIDKNGLAKSDPKCMYDKGWQGKEVLLINVIDREQMEWHRANKHTMLLAKSVNVDDNGNEWVDEGISSYATASQFTQLFKYYKSWENYDIVITKTGNKEHPFIIDNATRNPEKVEGKVAEFISQEDHLTDEEKSWERYDLNKLFRFTTNTKIYNRLKGTIARIDTALGTHFLSELEEEVAKEKVLFDQLYGTEETEGTTATPEVNVEESIKVTTAPTRARVVPATTSKEVWEQLPYGTKIPEALRSHVTNVVKNADGKYEITWDTPTDELASCPDCGAVAPLDCTICPSCGLDFTQG